ncbi:MAG: helix-turn-helix transcriptional regulator [Nitrospirota bacterium]
MTGRERAVYMISVVAEMLGVHPQTLRLYEREGFIRPGRTEGGVRLYSDNDIERIKLILNLTREMGVNLAGVDVILSMRERMEKQRAEMEDLMDEMRREFVAELKRRGEAPGKAVVKTGKNRIIKVKINEPRNNPKDR